MKNKLSDYPELVDEWDFEKNVDHNLSDTFSGRTKLWWKCSLNHSWEAVLTNRINGSKCPYCSGNKILAGFNDVFTLRPDLVDEWDYETNDELNIDPLTLGLGNHSKVWWKCDKSGIDHSYESSIASRNRGRSCPYCANKKVLVGFNDFATTSSELLKEWDYEKNSFAPYEITSGSDKKVYWLCDQGHSYQMSVYRRTNSKNSRGCPACSGKKVVESTSILAFPEIIKLWDYEKNTIDPGVVSSGSSKKYWWVGECGHSFQKPSKSIKNGSKCPYCVKGNTKLLKGFNDCATKAPHLVKEWSKKNDILKPSSFLAGSKKKAWWICENDHEWETVIEYRHRGKTSCPQCSMKGTLKLEKELQDFIKNIALDSSMAVFNSYQVIAPYELDVYIPEKKIAVEFNGLYWHSEAAGKDKNYHYNKWKRHQEKGIQLITVWEDDWLNNRSVVESMLKYKLGFGSDNKIYARKTFVGEVSNAEAEVFLNEYHIQGFRNITKNYGLFDKYSNILVAVMSFSINKNTVSLDRYATSVSVVGGFTKLLKYAVDEIEKSNSGIECITTFADHEVSDGGLYENNGFTVDFYIKPDYKYIYRNKRHHKFLFRKKRFENDPDLLFEESMTERELANLNGMSRVWDCGKTKYRKSL